MANSLHMKVLAEGMETSQRVALVASHGCRSAADAGIKSCNPTRMYDCKI
jgi:hypothetical protein